MYDNLIQVINKNPRAITKNNFTQRKKSLSISAVKYEIISSYTELNVNQCKWTQLYTVIENVCTESTITNNRYAKE